MVNFLKPFIFAVFIFLIFLQLARSFTVTCEAGGPYGSGSTVLVMGNVTGEVSNVSNVVVNISKSGAPRAAESTTSDSDGSYYTIFSQSFDIGSYDANVNASNATYSTSCSDTFDVILQQPITTSEQKTVTVQGKAMYTAGNPVSSGTVFISIENTTATNTTTISGGTFTISLTTYLYSTKRYLLYLSIVDLTGKKGTTQIFFTPT